MLTLRLKVIAASCLFLVTAVYGQTNKLVIPETLVGPTFNLTMAPSTHEFTPGVLTQTLAFNGSYLGPTLIFESQSDIELNVLNQIGEATTVHWHGMHVSPENDGGPHTVIADGSTWRPAFTVLDRATTFWYHPHLHHKTNEHVYRGLAGMIIVRDPVEAALNLPRTYGVDDIPVIIQDRQFDPSGQFVFNAGGVGAGGNTVLVNGTIDPYVELGAGVVRLRLLNGSNGRIYQIGLQNNKTFFQIGTDGGLLEQPNPLTRLRLAPGERSEILVDLSGLDGQTISLMSFSSELVRGEPGGVVMGPGPPPRPDDINGTDFQILEIRVSGTTGVLTIPDQLVTIDRIEESSANRTRPMLLNRLGDIDVINGVAMDLSVINEVIELGDTEIWSIQNVTGIPHPFHIHDIQFQILDRAGAPPEAFEAGWKDVVLVYPGEVVRFITKFEDFADPDTPYMYHCHFLGHEDLGMMGQFLVIDPDATVIERKDGPNRSFSLSSYPNPTTDWTTITYQLEKRARVKIVLYDALGREIKTMFEGWRDAGQNESIWKADGMGSGTYLIQITVDGKSRSLPVHIQR